MNAIQKGFQTGFNKHEYIVYNSDKKEKTKVDLTNNMAKAIQKKCQLVQITALEAFYAGYTEFNEVDLIDF